MQDIWRSGEGRLSEPRFVEVIPNLHNPYSPKYKIIVSNGIAPFANVALEATASRNTELMVFGLSRRAASEK